MTRDQCIGLMIRLEGHYANNPKDPGGATMCGITQRTLDSLQGKALPAVLPKNVKDLTEDQVYVIYRAVDWALIHGDELPKTLAPLMLNASVNMGEPTAVLLLQECLGVPRDATMGPKTLAALTTWHSPYLPEQTIAEEFAAHAAKHYADLDAKEGEFELGWFRRLFRVYTLAVNS